VGGAPGAHGSYDIRHSNPGRAHSCAQPPTVPRIPLRHLRSLGRSFVLCLLVVGGTTTACADLVSPSTEVTVILPAAADLLVMIKSLDDVSSRVGPALGANSAAGDVRSKLDELRSALNAADALAADKALQRAKGALAAYQAASDSPADEAPDASVVEVALLFVEASLKRPCESFPGASIVQSGTNPTSANSCGGR